MRPAPDTLIDYYQDWGSARNFRTGIPVYTPHSTSIPRHLGLPTNPNLSIEYNIHPPTSVLLALPLGRFDYSDAVLVWNYDLFSDVSGQSGDRGHGVPRGEDTLLTGLGFAAILPSAVFEFLSRAV